jgi:hypothetical protein
MEFFISKEEFKYLENTKFSQKVILYTSDNVHIYFGADYSQYVTKVTIEEIKDWSSKEICKVL